MDTEGIMAMFDEWIRDDSPIAALVFRQRLQPAQAPDAVVFPPTYTMKNTDRQEHGPGVYGGQNDLTGYNIDQLPDGTTVCQIDSEGSQANRMEPLFMTGRMRALVPQITIRVTDPKTGAVLSEVNLLEVGHRIADASVRFSDLRKDVDHALKRFDDGDAEPIARLAPTSIVFGAWDSRDTKVKIRALVRSVIRAYGVAPLHRSAQYMPPFDYREVGVVDSNTKHAADEGMAAAPAPWKHGGVKVMGEIRREAILSLETLRSLRAAPGGGKPDDTRTMQLRRYILGIALAALTAPQPAVLRQGCELVPVLGSPARWEIVRYDGTRQEAVPQPTHGVVLDYAEKAALDFRVTPDARWATFNQEMAREALDEKSRKTKRASRGSKPASEAGEDS
jgi:CRISPR-associated protein Csb1